MRPASGFRFPAVAVLIAFAWTMAQLSARPQQPTFREAIDVIEFDVRVVTGKGVPVLDLSPNDFEVSINGGRRRVVSADIVEYGPASAAGTRLSPAAPASGANTSAPWNAPRSVRTTTSGRVFVLVVDASSFDMASAAGVSRSARDFVLHLMPEDLVGLYVFPTGAQISPVADRGKIMNAFDRIIGEPAAQPNMQFNLRPSEVVALSPMMTGNAVTSRDGRLLVAQLCGNDLACQDRLRTEVAGLVNDYEAQATHSLGMMRSLIRNLGPIDARKTLVMISGGVVTADQPGTRPDIGNLDILIGQEAVKTNTAIYTLYVDWRTMQQSTAERRGAPRIVTPLSADAFLMSRSLEQFTGASGGVLFRALSGSGEVALRQILSETSAYYQLAVQPSAEDRDGKPRQLSVKTTRSGVAVRGSKWVTVEKR